MSIAVEILFHSVADVQSQLKHFVGSIAGIVKTKVCISYLRYAPCNIKI